MDMTEKYQILEPLSSMVELALLNFSKDSPKITIKNHGINIDIPSDRYIPQSLSRFLGGDSKEDIFILNLMVVNYIDWFIINDYNSKFDIYRDIALYAVSGLRKLQHTYKSGNVVLALQYYIMLIMKAIADIEVKRKRIKLEKSEEHSVRKGSIDSEPSTKDKEDSEDDFSTGGLMPEFTASTILPNVDDDESSQGTFSEKTEAKLKDIEVDSDIGNRDDSMFISHNTIADGNTLKLWTLPVEQGKSIVDTRAIKEIWSSSDVDNLYKMLSDCFVKDNDYHFKPKSDAFVNAKITALMEVLKGKDKSFNKIIKNSYGGT